MDSSADTGGYSAAPPPVGNVGCFKGVMLCNRPPDDLPRLGAGEASHPPPFKSTISATHREQVGLPPAKDDKKEETASDVKTRGPSAALRRHCQWIKELQEQVRDDQRQAEERASNEQERRQRMQEAFKRQRDAIQQIKKERDRGSIQRHEIEAIIAPKEGKRPHRGTQKPLWAMTEEERDGAEDEEADELIRFAEGVDFDQYMSDLEFRQGIEALRDRAKRLQREQEAFKDSILKEFNGPGDDDGDGSVSAGAGDDARTEGGGDRAASRRTRAGADAPAVRPDWDASTACSDERPARDGGGDALLAAADRILEANPQLRAVHSKGSVKRLVERASEQGSVSGLSAQGEP